MHIYIDNYEGMEEKKKGKRDTNIETCYEAHGIINRLLEAYCQSLEILVNRKESQGIQENPMEFQTLLTILVNFVLMIQNSIYYFFLANISAH